MESSPNVAVAPAPVPSAGAIGRKWWPTIVPALLLIAAVAVAVPFLWSWVEFRRHHSITDDAFVEAHIVNIAPQMVSGRVVRFLVEEDDRVTPGQLLAEIDPIPYRDKVNLARAKLDAARADLARQEADLERVRKQVPIEIAIAERTLAAARTDRARAEESQTLTRDQVEKGIDEARAGVKAARASLTLAELEYGRFSRLTEQGASTKERQQQVTQSRDSAQAQVDLAEAKLALALASRTQVDIARSALEGAQTGTEKAARGVDLSQLGYDQIHELELLVKVKELTVQEAVRALESAEHDLEYTLVRAPFPGVVVKRYRNLGDFAPAGATLLSLYNPELLYVEANLEETRLTGVAPGNPVRIEIDAFAEPFRGRVVWINKSTGAQFALMPRNVVSGEFTRVVQRVPVRIWIERDDRWPMLRAGLSARVAIARGKGDPAWAAKASRELAEYETRYNAPAPSAGVSTMSTTSAPPPAMTPSPPALAAPARRRVRAALAIFLVLVTVYQTLVLTVVTDDVIRKAIEADEYDMIWVNVAWGVAILYSVFAAFWLAARYGMRITLGWGLLLFAIGNLLLGAAVNLTSTIVARSVEGIGKGLAIAVGRATLYKQFDRMLLVAIGFYGVCAYATRPSTPLVTAYINDWLSWRWIYWVNVPLALAGLVAVLRYIRPDRPPKPAHVPVDWLALTTFVAWVVCILFAFGWYRKWGGWTSNAFAAVVILCVTLPVVLAIWLGSGFSPDEHLKRLLRSRVYVLSMMVRVLLLLNLAAVLTIVGKYLIELRDDPRVTAGWVMVPASLTMAASTLLTTVFHRRRLRHVWLFVGVLGASACLWWLGSLDNFTAKGHVALILACWGACLGLFPPVFLADEVEGLNPKDMMYAGALAIVGLIVPLVTIPTMTGTVTKAWSDRALDVYRANLSEDRPPVAEAGARVADYYRQRGLAGAELRRETSTVLGTFAAAESVAVGFRQGFRFLSLAVLGLGLTVAVLLSRAARDLRAPPGAGYS